MLILQISLSVGRKGEEFLVFVFILLQVSEGSFGRESPTAAEYNVQCYIFDIQRVVYFQAFLALF